MVEIGAGWFRMGWSDGLPSERPRHRVWTDAFAIARFPVTNREYARFLEDTSADPPPWWTDPRFGEPAQPVVGTSWFEAVAYCEWLSATTAAPHRLPTEAEWEKAARGADGRRYPWGDQFDASFCKMRLSRPGLARPEPSGAFPIDVSPYGVRDLAGGLADWVMPTTELAREQGLRRLATRGGAWCDWPSDCRLDARRSYLEIERSPRIGFRLAVDL